MARTLVVAVAVPYQVAVSADAMSVRLAAAHAQASAHWLQAGPLETALAMRPEAFPSFAQAVQAALGSKARLGVAQAIALDEEGLPLGTRTLVRALMLSRLAKPGEVLVHRSSELFAACQGAERSGKIAGRRVRGRALRSSTALREPTYIGSVPTATLVLPGRLGIVRADPGRGGTRVLQELAKQIPTALVIRPSGASHEPLGALRHALLRRLGIQTTEPLRSLLSGDGVLNEDALDCLVRALATEAGLAPVLIDDASAVDAATLSVCAQLVHAHRVPLVIRLDATELTPIALSALPRSGELDVCPLSHGEATRLAQSMFASGMRRDDLSQIMEMAGIAPVNVVQAVLSERTRETETGRSDLRIVERWFVARMRRLAPRQRRVLQALALVVGEVSLDLVASMLDMEAPELDGYVQALAEAFFVDTHALTVRLRFASTRDWILGDMNESECAEMHLRAAEVLVERGRGLEVSDAVHHFAQAGDHSRAAEVCLLVARRATELGYDSSGLLALARELDPEIHDRTSQNVYSSIPVTLALLHEVMVSPDSVRSVLPEFAHEEADEQVPTAMLPPKVPAEGARLSPRESVPERPAVKQDLGTLILGAIREGNLEAAERWIDALAATAKSSGGAERLRACVRLLRGDDGNALRILRQVRSKASGDKRICQADLALGYAYLTLGRIEQARYATLLAMVSAKRLKDARSLAACAHMMQLIATRAGVTFTVPLAKAQVNPSTLPS